MVCIHYGHIFIIIAEDLCHDLTKVTCGMRVSVNKTYQVVVASSSGHDIWYNSLALPDECHKLEDDPRVMLHLVH